MKLANITSNKWFPVVILFLLVLLFFSPVFLHGRVIFPDLLNYYEPWNDYAQDLPFRYSHLKSDFVDALIPKINLIKTELEQGNVSLWSDTVDLGKPLIQTSLEFLLMPIYIFVWILPTDIGFTIAIILKTLIGAFGMYFWLVDLKVRKGVAIIVGVVYAFSGFNSSWFLGNAAIVGQFAPWAFLCVNRIYDSKSVGRLWGNSFALILVYFFLIVSGFVAGAGYIIYFSAFYVLILFMGRAMLRQNLSAVTGACLMVDKKKYLEVGGLDDKNLKVAFNDIGFCLKLLTAGYRNVWTPFAELYHYESASRGYEDTIEKQERFKSEVLFMMNKWKEIIGNDPAYNLNLSLERQDLGLAFPPRKP